MMAAAVVVVLALAVAVQRRLLADCFLTAALIQYWLSTVVYSSTHLVTKPDTFLMLVSLLVVQDEEIAAANSAQVGAVSSSLVRPTFCNVIIAATCTHAK